MTQNSSILTVGSLAFDSIKTPKGNAETVLGGSGNYFSVAASFFAPVRLVGVVGQDFPKNHLEWMGTRQIDVHGVEHAKGETFHWVGEYDGNMNEAKTLSTRLNVFEHFNPKIKNEHKSTPYVFLANIDPVLQQRVLDQLTDHNLVICDSMNFWITGKLADLKKTLKRVDILSINEGEARLLSGQSHLGKAADIIRDMGPSIVVIKRGEHGSTLYTGNGLFVAPSFPVSDVVDPTGAGDTFAGGFVGTLAKMGAHRDLIKSDPKKMDLLLRQAVVSGTVMASFTVEDFSLHRLMRLEHDEFQDRRRHFIQMMKID
jgi:sugar/nucleoside kinase (ribokinase family)